MYSDSWEEVRMRQANRWWSVVGSALMLAVIPVSWVADLRPVAAAQATDVMVRCPNRDEIHLDWPRNSLYSAGRTELRWRVLVEQPVRYWFRVLSPASFSTAVILERGGRWFPGPSGPAVLAGRHAAPGPPWWSPINITARTHLRGSAWERYHDYTGSGSDEAWLWIIVRPHQPSGQYLVTLQMQCDGPRGPVGPGPGPVGPPGPGPVDPCEGLLGQGNC